MKEPIMENKQEERKYQMTKRTPNEQNWTDEMWIADQILKHIPEEWGTIETTMAYIYKEEGLNNICLSAVMSIAQQLVNENKIERMKVLNANERSNISFFFIYRRKQT